MGETKKEMTVAEYRKKHKRCKTCHYAESFSDGWCCYAKGTTYFGELGQTGIKGRFCKLYKHDINTYKITKRRSYENYSDEQR